MDLNQAKALLFGGATNEPDGAISGASTGIETGIVPPSTNALPPTLTPKTDVALTFANTPAMRSAAKSFPVSMPVVPPGVGMSIGMGMAQEAKSFKEENTMGDIPLDTDTGASSWERMMLGFRREKQNQIQYLENKYGPGTVREASNGELIVRMPDPNDASKTKDVLVNEDKMTAKDFIGLMGQAPEIAASMFATKGAEFLPYVGKLKGVVGALRDIAAAAVGGETAGGIKDVGMNVYDRGAMDLKNVAKDRALMGAVDVAAGSIGIPAAKFLQFLKNPASIYRKQVQFDALGAQKYFMEKYGVNVPLSIGESTGMPLASRSEVFYEKLPGGSEPLRALKSKQEEGLRTLQRMMMGAAPADEEIGQAAMDAIRAKIEPTVAAAQTAKSELAQTATSGIEGIISGASQPERELYKSTLGGDIRQKVISLRDEAKAQADSLYDAVRSMPGGEGKVFDAKPLQKSFGKILDSLPAPSQTVDNPQFLVDASGAPIRSSQTEVKTLREFVPSNILTRLQSVVGLKDAQFSLSDLQQMRREVYDDIAKGEGVPGLGTHYLNDMGKALTSAIENGVEQMPDGQLKSALQAANQHYKENVLPFNRGGITELFRRADEPGFISDSEIVGHFLSGDKAIHNWNTLKDTVGEASPEFTRMKRAVLDNILERSRLPGDAVIDAKSLMNNLASLRQASPEITDDIFGKNSPDLFNLFKQSRYLDIAQGGKIDAEQLQNLLQGGNVTTSKLQALIDAQKKADDVYKNQLVKAIGTGTLNDQSLRPTDFVNRVLDTASTKDVKAVVDMLGSNPKLLEDLQQKTFEKVFRDGARSATAEDVNRIMSGDSTHILSGVKIADRLKDQEYQSKLKAILGPDKFQDLEQYVKLQAAGEAKEKSFQSAGGIAAGSQIAALEKKGVFSFLTSSMRNFVYSTLMSRAPLRQWLTNIPSEPGKLQLLFTSPVFLQAVSREYTDPDAAKAFISRLYQGISDSYSASPQASQDRQQTPLEQSREKWKLILNNPTPPPANPGRTPMMTPTNAPPAMK